VTTTAGSRPRIVVCANLAWNLVNFRAGLIQALIARGYEIVAVAPPDAAMQQRLEDLGCRFVAAPIDAMGLSPLRDLKTFLVLFRIIRLERPVAWLSWTIKPNVYGTFAAGLLGVPALPNVSGLGTAFIRRNLLTALVKQLYRAAFRKAKVVFFQNSDDRLEFTSAGLLREDQTRLLPGSGIDLAQFVPHDCPSGAPNRFLLVARLLGDKGVREFVEAAGILKSQGIIGEYRLIGFLDVANRTAISRIELDAWIAEGLVEYLAPTDDIRPVLAATDWVVLPSYREGLSRVLLEAGATGRPAITTDVPGCRDIISEGVNGYLAAPRDAGSLAQAMVRAAKTSREHWQLMADNARLRVEQEFSQDRVNTLYLDALSQAHVPTGALRERA
jgi:glycosyltransferase involved in cell wall biosynthesis